MANTLLSSIETQARDHLIESTATFWTSAEIIRHVNNGIKDMWRSIVDLKQEYFLVIDTTNVSLAADTSTLTGVPDGIHKVYLIEPRDVSSDSDNKNLHFDPVDYNHPRARAARTQDAVSPSNNLLYYSIVGAGGPIDYDSGIPAGVNISIYVQPQVSTAVNLSLSYVPVLPTFTASEEHPIPGEADQALIAWTVAYARAKEREDRMPDPGWLQIYNTEKQNILQSLGVRQVQEPTIVDAFFESYWG